MHSNQLFIGTSGFYLQNFYPKDNSVDKLSFYSKVFKTVEINSTFYHIPRQQTIDNWLGKDVIFSFKVFKGFTHFQGIYDKDKLREWFELFKPFGQEPAKYLMLFQFPASFTYNKDQFNNLLLSLPNSFLFAFEFRHPSWFVDEVYEKLLINGLTLVISDGLADKDGQPIWPKFDLNANFSYIRFHGSSKLYSSSYTREELEKYAILINQKIKAGKKVYCYFNNDAKGCAAENARELIKLIEDEN